MAVRFHIAGLQPLNCVSFFNTIVSHREYVRGQPLPEPSQFVRNVDLVNWVVRLAKELDREIATPARVRALFRRYGKVNFSFLKPEVVA